MLKCPTTIAEVNQMIADGVQEGLHLDYKDHRAVDKTKKHDVAKDVSAFANSDGGLLIYGVSERDGYPVSGDPGVEHRDYKREWFEQVISSKISPRIDDVRVGQIPVNSDRSIYTVEVQKSFRGPHQAPDHKYYKRRGTHCEPMEHYEIDDVRSRRRIVSPLVNVGVQVKDSEVYLLITNIGNSAAEDVSFEVPDELRTWIEAEQVTILTNGIKYLPPKRVYTFDYGFINAIVQNLNTNPPTFDVNVSYYHPEVGQRISDVFHIDLMDYWGASILKPEIVEHGKGIEESIDKLTAEVSKLNAQLAKLSKK